MADTILGQQFGALVTASSIVTDGAVWAPLYNIATIGSVVTELNNFFIDLDQPTGTVGWELRTRLVIPISAALRCSAIGQGFLIRRNISGPTVATMFLRTELAIGGVVVATYDDEAFPCEGPIDESQLVLWNVRDTQSRDLPAGQLIELVHTLILDTPGAGGDEVAWACQFGLVVAGAWSTVWHAEAEPSLIL